MTKLAACIISIYEQQIKTTTMKVSLHITQIQWLKQIQYLNTKLQFHPMLNTIRYLLSDYLYDTSKCSL